MQRRTFIIAAVAGGVGLVEYTYMTSWMNSLHNPYRVSVRAFESYGAQAALAAITPNDEFYVTSKGTTPVVKAADWRFTFDGRVAHPFTLTYQDLLALPQIEKELTLECISNSIGGNAIGNAKWTGTPLKPLIERAQPLPGAAYAAIYAADGFSTGHPLERLWNEENFIAYQMNGEDLPAAHGYPVRIFVPGKFGMKQPKWLTRIELLDRAYTGYWEKQGWSDTSERLAHARFTDLKDGARLSGKNLELEGFAIGNLDGIRAVEISFDDGATWRPASIFSQPSPLTWVFWKYVWVNPKPGDYTLRLRAVDGKGKPEDYEPRGIFPDGATGQQIMKVTVI